MSTTIHGRRGFGLGGAGIDQSVRYTLDEMGSDVSTLLGPAVVLVAMIATLRIALSQHDQSATTKTRTRRAPKPDAAPIPDRPAQEARGAERGAHRSEDSRRRPGFLTPPAPAGFNWVDAAPAPRIRSGLALLVMLAMIGALLAMAVAGLVVGATVVFKGI